MTQNYFTPLPILSSGQIPEITGNIINPPMGELDSAITDVLAGDISFTQLRYGDGGELTISSGAITVTSSYHNVDTEADAPSDSLATINGMVANDICYIRANNTTRSVVVRHNTGNIKCVGSQDITLDDTEKIALLFHNGTDIIGMGLGIANIIPFVSTCSVSEGSTSYSTATDHLISMTIGASGYDTDSYQTSTTLYTLPSDGSYRITFNCIFLSGTTGERKCWISKNRSTSEVILITKVSDYINSVQSFSITFMLEGSSGDELEFYLRHEEGSNINAQNEVTITRIKL